MRVIARMNIGGPAVQVAGLARGLDETRFDHRTYVGRVGPDEEDHVALRDPDLDVRTIEGLGRSPRAMADGRAFAALLREMRSFRPHIVHTHTAKAGLLGRAAARACGIPTVHTFHGHLLTGYFRPSTTRAITTVERAQARSTAKLLAVGAQVRDELLAAGIGRPDQYAVVPPGVSLPDPPLRSLARELLGIPADASVLSFVGRLEPVKRPDRMLDVLRRLTASGLQVTVLVSGSGSLRGSVEAAAAGDPNVRFLGWRPDVEVVHAASDLALLTSDNEGMPVSLIEAAFCGVPAVATDVGSVREVVVDGSTGRVVPADPAALVGAVEQLLSDPTARASAGEAARERARRRFSTERLVADVERVYDEVLDAQRARRGRR